METAGFMDGRGESYGWKRLVEGMGPVGDRLGHVSGGARWAAVHGTGDNMTSAIRNDGFKGTATQEHNGCDHTSTNAPNPIRTPQLRIFGRE